MSATKITPETPVLTKDCYICGGMIVHGEGRYEGRQARYWGYTVARHDDCSTATR